MEASKQDCCKGDCEETATERMNYFTGLHLAARDFQDEQTHHRSHRFLHNRMLHGWGVVCGLEVKKNEQPGCENRYVTVSPGMAIDCCGREILMNCPACCSHDEPEIPWEKYSQARPWLVLCLTYYDEPKKPVPVLSSEGDCSSANTETKHSRYKESWKLSWHWVAKSDLKKFSWNPLYAVCPKAEEPHNKPAKSDARAQVSQAASQVKLVGGGQPGPAVPNPPTPKPDPYHPEIYDEDSPHDDCGDPYEEGFRSCIAQKCPPNHCVPLALICVEKKPGSDTSEPGKVVDIIMRGRPEVPNAPQRLTHITEINWPHGRVVPSSWFKRNKGFVVTFDRKLREAKPRKYPGPSGVNQATFVVEYGGGAGFEDLDFVPFDFPPRSIEGGLKAEYRVRSRDGFGYLENHVVWITLKCDFLFDCHGVRVDGDNDGVVGGTFESWVSVVSDAAYRQLQREQPDEYARDEERSGGPQQPPEQYEDSDRDDNYAQLRKQSDELQRRLKQYEESRRQAQDQPRRRDEHYGQEESQ